MKISRFLFPTGDLGTYVDEIVKTETHGYHSVWLPQVFSWDALAVIAVAGSRTTRLRFGTSVIPTYPTHPLVMAASAMTAQSATGGRLTLGVGASHRFLVEDAWGMSYDRPMTRMRAYLAALVPAMSGDQVAVETDQLIARTVRPLELPGTPRPPVLIAALGPKMLDLAGTEADGTVTWLAGAHTLLTHVVPTITAAAERCERPRPSVVAGLPVCVTSEPAAAMTDARDLYAAYTQVPSYRAVLDREGAAEAADVALVGAEDVVAERLDELRAAGVSEFCASVFGSDEDQARTHRFLSERALTETHR